MHLWIPYYKLALVSLGSTIYWFKSRCLQRPFKLMDGFIVVLFLNLCFTCLDLEYLEYIKFVIFLFLPFWAIAISLLALFRTWRTCFSWCFIFSVLMQVFYVFFGLCFAVAFFFWLVTLVLNLWRFRALVELLDCIHHWISIYNLFLSWVQWPDSTQFTCSRYLVQIA